VQTLKKLTLTHVLLAVIAVMLGLTYHRLFLMDQDIENNVEFSQQIATAFGALPSSAR